MSEAAGADTVGDVKHNVVRTRGIARDSADTPKVIEAEKIPNAPGNVVVGTGSITADAKTADEHLALRVQTQTAAEHVHSADPLADHGIDAGTVASRRPFIRDRRIDRVARREGEEAAARLDG